MYVLDIKPVIMSFEWPQKFFFPTEYLSLKNVKHVVVLLTKLFNIHNLIIIIII